MKGRRIVLLAGLFVAALFLALNAVAYAHAYAMLHFADCGERTGSIESLSCAQRVRVLLTGITVPRPRNTATPSDLGLAFETHRISTPDGTLEAWRIPRAEPRGTVVMFHGYSAAKASLLPEARAFHDLGYDVFLVDLRGNGGSFGDSTSIGFLEADDVARSASYVRRRLAAGGPLILYGQSMGGVAVLRSVQAKGVRPTAVIVEAVFDTMLGTIGNRFHSMGLPAFPFAHLLLFWGGCQLGFSGFENNPVDWAPRVACPVLMLHGSDDPRARVAQGEAVFRRLASSRKTFERFEGLRHESCCAGAPDHWRRVVDRFLSECAAP